MSCTVHRNMYLYKGHRSTKKSKYINKSFHLLPVLRRGMFFLFTIKDKQTLHMHGCYGAK